MIDNPILQDSPGHSSAQPLRSWELAVVDAVGSVIEFWGFKHNHGRVWALLYLRQTSMTAAELQEVLGLSKGAVSMLTRELEQWHVLLRVRSPAQGTWRFEANPNFMDMVRRVLDTREREFLARVARDLASAELQARLDPSAPEGAAARVARMKSLAELVQQVVGTFLKTAVMDANPLFDVLRETARRLRNREKS